MSLTIYPTNVKFNNNGEYKSIMAAAEGDIVRIPYNSNPAMDGTASSGVSDSYARGDHVHPTDTTRQEKITASGILKGDGTGSVYCKTFTLTEDTTNYFFSWRNSDQHPNSGKAQLMLFSGYFPSWVMPQYT